MVAGLIWLKSRASTTITTFEVPMSAAFGA
jgi:hypothetical protein